MGFCDEFLAKRFWKSAKVGFCGSSMRPFAREAAPGWRFVQALRATGNRFLAVYGDNNGLGLTGSLSSGTGKKVKFGACHTLAGDARDCMSRGRDNGQGLTNFWKWQQVQNDKTKGRIRTTSFGFGCLAKVTLRFAGSKPGDARECGSHPRAMAVFGRFFEKL